MKKILIVDDEASNIAILADILKPEYEIFAARGGEEALKRLETAVLPDLVLLDVRMPGMDGYQVCTRLKEAPRTANIPVIFVTALDDAENEARGLELGAADYITRPFGAAVVKARVKAHLELARARRESESRYRALFANMADGVVIHDPEGRILEVNEAFCRCTGYDREELLEMTTGDIAREGDGQPHAKRLAQVRREGSGVFEIRHTRRDGTTFPVEVHVRLVELDGEIAALAVCRDVTERKRIEAELEGYREHLEELVRRRTAELLKKERALADLERDIKKRRSFQNLVGRSEAMRALYARLEDLADVGSTVVIVGESGTGKELAAEALHYGGARQRRPFVKVVCSDLSETLVESELFGHVKGAFTGAVRGRVGRFEKAADGTLFLDEIGDIPEGFQRKLLRVVEERRFERVGASTPIPVGARIVAATRRDLGELVRRGLFREDLYYRLKVVELKLPPLRERPGDIPLLVRHFLDELNRELEKEVRGVSAEVLELFEAYRWPGNVRELKHVLEHACVACKGEVVTAAHLPQGFHRPPASAAPEGPGEAETLRDALGRARWNKSRAARMLGISRQTLYRKLRELRLDEEERFED